MVYNKPMCRLPLQVVRAIGWGVILLGTNLAFAEDERWYTNDQVERGAIVFTQNCAACHGANAEATPNWRRTTPDGKYPPPPLNGTAHTWHHPLDMLRRQIKLGGEPVGGVMPAFKDKLSPADIDAAIAFFQSKWSDEIFSAWMKRNRKAGGSENITSRRLRTTFRSLPPRR